jgi:hypothetical protein
LNEATEPGPPPYTTRPPLWQPPAEKRASRIYAGIAVGLVLASFPALALVFGERVVLASAAIPLVVTVVEADRVHAHGDAPAELRYQVMLPDGVMAHLWSPHVYAVGDRLSAMVSRGRLTGRVFVTAPYAVLPRD